MRPVAPVLLGACTLADILADTEDDMPEEAGTDRVDVNFDTPDMPGDSDSGDGCEPSNRDFNNRDYLFASNFAREYADIGLGEGCEDVRGPDAVFEFDPSVQQAVVMTRGDDVVIHVNASCDPLAPCLPITERWGLETFEAPEAGTYTFIVESHDRRDDDLVASFSRRRPEDCTNGLDEDWDQRIDCHDPACFGTSACLIEDACLDGEDNDADGSVDCADLDCSAHPECAGPLMLDEGFYSFPPVGWTAQSGWRSHYTATLPYPSWFSGTVAFGSTQAGNCLISPEVDLSDMTEALLTFSSHLSEPWWGSQVLISVDGGNWQSLPLPDDGFLHPTVVHAELSAYTGYPVRLRFMVSPAEWGYWALNDVRIYAQ